MGFTRKGDPRRDRAYSIFYVGINLGAFLAPLICGTLGEKWGWHYGFGAAGVGMLIGLLIYLRGLRELPPDELQKAKAAHVEHNPMSREEWRAILALLILFLPNTLFWATYEQQGNTIALWADSYTDRSINLLFWQGEIPVTWFQAFNPFMIFAFTPLIVELWAIQSRRGREPSTVTKMAMGCFGVALSYLVMVAAALYTGPGGESELALAVPVFRHHHGRRALSLSRRAFARLESCARARHVPDDGRLAFHELSRQFSRGLARLLLEQHGEAQFFPDDRGRGRRRGCVDHSSEQTSPQVLAALTHYGLFDA